MKRKCLVFLWWVVSLSFLFSVNLTARSFPIEVDARALSAQEVFIASQGRFPTQITNTVNLAPGTYSISYQIGAHFPQIAFSVLSDGTVDFPASADGVLTGRGSTRLVVNGVETRIDARLLSSRTVFFLIERATRSIHTLRLLPGTHTISYRIGSHFPQVSFTVDSVGRVDYNSGLDNVLQGRGTSTLLVRGVDIRLDARNLTSRSLLFLHAFATREVQSFTLLPGTHSIAYQIGASFPGVLFTVGTDGSLDYDGTLDGLLSGRGTSELIVRGLNIQIDARALTSRSLFFLHAFSTSEIQTFTLLPGQHGISYQSGDRFPGAFFTVGEDGLLDFDAALDGALSGRGTSELVVHGLDIRIDARALTSRSLFFLHAFSTSEIQTFTLLPGNHGTAYQTGANFPGIRFTVLENGTLDYDSSLDGVLQGRGTSDLLIRGIDILVDARSLSSQTLFFLNPFATEQVTSATLLPGTHVLSYQSSNGFPGVLFTVLADGSLDFDASLDAVMTGRGTDTLTIQGLPIRLDATSLGTSLYSLAGIGRFSPESVRSLLLLPGLHDFGAPSSSFVFTVREDGTVDYDSSFDPFVSGRNTDTIVVSGPSTPPPAGDFPITLDARPLSAPLLTLSGPVQLQFSTDVEQLYDLSPGTYTLSYDAVNSPQVEFSVLPNGTVDYAPTLEDVLSGSGTDRLSIDGFPLEIDSSALSSAYLQLRLTDSVVVPSLATLRLLPGLHAPFYVTGIPTASVEFEVKTDGTFDFAPSLDGLLLGRNTTRLTIQGAAITIDTSALSASFLFMTLNSGDSAVLGGETSLRLLPGRHSPFYVTGIPIASVEFTVLADGSIDFDTALDGLMSGRGSNRLDVFGAEISIDPSPLSASFLFMTLNSGDSAVLNGPTDFRLLPGRHIPAYFTPLAAALAEFTVRTDATVDFDSDIDEILQGRGSSALLVDGAQVSIDAVLVQARLFGMVPTGILAARLVQNLSLLPGRHFFDSSDARFEFEVRADETFDYAPLLDTFLSGRGTDLLVVSGSTVGDPPIACCQDVVVGADASCLGSVTPLEVDNGSFDPEGGPLDLTLSPEGPFQLGLTNVTLTVTDTAGQQDSCSAVIVVEDLSPPVPEIDPLPDVTGECSARITESPNALDNCEGSIIGTTTDPLVYDEQGTFTVTWTYSDAAGNSSTQLQTIVVDDVTAPGIDSIAATPAVLWPPNHQLVSVEVEVIPLDNCEGAVGCRIVSVRSNEPINGLGDGDTSPDWVITGDLTVDLRAERSGLGSGRIYTLEVECVDEAGNATVDEVQVSVPHDQS